jgi:hypothetical protein
MKRKERVTDLHVRSENASWFYPKSTSDPGSDRNARTLQFSCFLFAFSIGVVAMLDAIGQGPHQAPLLVLATAGLVAASVMNRAGRSGWAARTAFLAMLLTAILLVFEAHDGFRSHAMLFFPGLLLISVMLPDRTFYVTTASVVLVAVAALGIAVKQGLTRATPPIRSSPSSVAGSPTTPRGTSSTCVPTSTGCLPRTSN